MQFLNDLGDGLCLRRRGSPLGDRQIPLGLRMRGGWPTKHSVTVARTASQRTTRASNQLVARSDPCRHCGRRVRCLGASVRLARKLCLQRLLCVDRQTRRDKEGDATALPIRPESRIRDAVWQPRSDRGTGC